MFVRCLFLFVVLTIITGVIYPLAVLVIGQTVFHHTANGSLIVKEGKIIGSELIGQKFISDKYFWGRPSAVDYSTMPSGASNLGPISKDLKKDVESRKELLLKSKPEDFHTFPPELLFSSGSGIDPGLRLSAVNYQLDRVAKARNIDKSKIEDVIDQYTHTAIIFMGVPRVNILKLNLALDALK
jgi:K+-transporting ATPase ATPase C chain